MAKKATKSKKKTVSEEKNTAAEAQETPAKTDTETPPEVEQTPPETSEGPSETVPGAPPETPSRAAEMADVARVQTGKADNCSEKCSHYEDCKETGNLSKFVPGMVCTHISLENETDGKESQAIEDKRYIFPRQGDIKCPACGLYETVATSSPKGPIQWRRCTRAIPPCRHTFKITGTEVKITDCKQDD